MLDSRNHSWKCTSADFETGSEVIGAESLLFLCRFVEIRPSATSTPDGASFCLRAYQAVEQASPGHFDFQISLDSVTHSKHPQGVYSLVRG